MIKQSLLNQKAHLNKFSRRWVRQLFRQRVIIVFMLALQLSFLIYFILYSSSASKILDTVFKIISASACLYIVNRHDKGAFKLAWIFLILIFPVAGGLLYLTFSFQSTTRSFGERYSEIDRAGRPLFTAGGHQTEKAADLVPEFAPQINYLLGCSGFPAYMHTKTYYLNSGEEKLNALLSELKKAEKYIFLEYFIIESGSMWNPILNILKEKVKNGVKVRIIYDDMGCFLLLPNNYPKIMHELGIECAVFNPFRPILTARQNNRDHRKIAVIDGKVAFTGGINIADEYINEINKHGHWKDTAVMLKGDAAWSFTLIFLEMWKLCTDPEKDNASIKNRLFRRKKNAPPLRVGDFMDFYPGDMKNTESDGIVQPFADSPLDREHIGEHVYTQIISNAKKYVYITTPYLILDDSLISALILAAKSGIDVRIITPHIGDHKFVHLTTRSYYHDLIEGGVKIYEYTPGFIHAKTFVSDDKVGVVGTINLDFRSLYHHFECGVLMYGSDAIEQMKSDFDKTLKQCRCITEDDCRGSILRSFYQNLLRLFAPLM